MENSKNLAPREKIARNIPLVLGLAALGAACMVLWATANGPGATPDSLTYFETAKSLRGGQGFQSRDGVPITHYPPVYPLVIALAGKVEKDLLQATRFLHAFFFGVNVMLIGYATCIAARRNLLVVLCATLVFMFSKDMFTLHVVAWSEALFITFVLAASTLLALYSTRPRRSVLYAVATLLGCAMMTRYVGVTLLPPMLACLLLFGNRPIKDRMRDSVVLLAIGCAPLALWLLRNLAVAGTATNRGVALHPITALHIKHFMRTMAHFWLPIESAEGLIIFQLTIGAVLMGATYRYVVSRKQHRGDTDVVASGLQTLALLFCTTYILFLLVSISFFDAHTPLDSRILSPVYVFLVLLATSWYWSAMQKTVKRSLRWGLSVCLGVLLSINASQTMSFASSMHQYGVGYTSWRWRNSDTLKFLRTFPPGTRLYSNGADVIAFLTGIKAMMLPAKASPTTMEGSPTFRQEMETMRTDMCQNGSVVAYLDNIIWRWYLPTQQELDADLKLARRHRLADGTLYWAKVYPGGEAEQGAPLVQETAGLSPCQ
jgi:hypothetical protein